MIVSRSHSVRTGRLVGTEDAGPIDRPGRGPCLVAFHGFTGTTSEIRPLADAVAERGFAVRAPLLPGHGSKPHDLQDTTFEHWVDAMAEEVVRAQRDHRRFVLCGFSLGSLVAMEIASRRPEGLAGLVLLGNAITLSAPVSAALGFVDRRGWQLPDWYLLKLWSSDIRDPAMRARIVSYDRDPLRAALEVYKAGRRVRPKLRAIDVPALVLHGAKDRVCPPANARAVAAALGSKDVATRVFPRSGHLVAADHDRAEVAAEVLRLLERLST